MKLFKTITLFQIMRKGEMNMAIGFVLITAAPAHEHDVYNKLSKVPEIVELHPLFGEFDIIAKIETDDFESLGNIVSKQNQND